MKLISMTDFVLEQEDFLDITNKQKLECIIKYANFLKQPLELWMFVPVDENGNVLECPHNYGLLNLYPTGDKLMDLSFKDSLEFQQAKERCLFEGFDLLVGQTINTKNPEIFGKEMKDLIIEDLVKYNLQLTPTAIKQLGL